MGGGSGGACAGNPRMGERGVAGPGPSSSGSVSGLALAWSRSLARWRICCLSSSSSLSRISRWKSAKSRSCGGRWENSLSCGKSWTPPSSSSWFPGSSCGGPPRSASASGAASSVSGSLSASCSVSDGGGDGVVPESLPESCASCTPYNFLTSLLTLFLSRLVPYLTFISGLHPVWNDEAGHVP